MKEIKNFSFISAYVGFHNEWAVQHKEVFSTKNTDNKDTVQHVHYNYVKLIRHMTQRTTRPTLRPM